MSKDELWKYSLTVPRTDGGPRWFARSRGLVDQMTREWEGGLEIDEVVSAVAVDLFGDASPELVLSVELQCGGGGVLLYTWNGRGWQLRWLDVAMEACLDESDGGWLDLWPSLSGERPDFPLAHLEGTKIIWKGKPMSWQDGKGMVPSPSAGAGYRRELLSKAKTLLAESQALTAFHFLPRDAPAEVRERVAQECEKQVLRVLRNERPRMTMVVATEDGARDEEFPIDEPRLTTERIGLLEAGLRCSPNSRRLQAQLELQQARLKRLEAKAEREERRREELERRRQQQALVDRFMGQTAGPFEFGIARGQAKRACLAAGGSWDGSGQKLVACRIRGAVFGAGFCGRRACSLYVNQTGSGSNATYLAVKREIEQRYGRGDPSRRGTRQITTWEIDEDHIVEIGFSSRGGLEMFDVAFHSQGRR